MKPSTKAITLFVLLGLFILAGCGGGSSSNSGADDNFTLVLDIVPDQINIQGGGSAIVRVSLFDQDAQPVPDAAVILTTTLGTLGASTVTTGEDGSATTTLSPSDTTTVGNATVTATYGLITVNSDLIEFFLPLG
jgi:hypothetical protein